MKKYRYAHLFFVDELKFSTRLIEMIQNPENGFKPEEYIFATPHEAVYNALSGICNIELYDKKQVSSMINAYAQKAEWVFLHSVPPLYKRIFIKPKYLKQILWRTWGHDASNDFREGEFIKNLIKGFCYFIWKNQVRHFRAVGIANTVDRIDIRNHFGDVSMFRMPYTSAITHDIGVDETNINEKKWINVLVGHSGFARDNHIEIINELNAIDSMRIKMFLVLSYGEAEYIKKVCDYVESKNMKNVVIIKEFMPYEKYIELVANMDVGILDADISYALGNIEWLLYFKKKIFLNRNGVIKKAFDYDQIPYACTDEISKMSYNDFIVPINYVNAKTEILPQSYEKNIDNWKTILNSLE